MADPQRTGLPSQSENRTFSHDITIILYVCTVILADPLPKAAKKSPKPSFPLAVSITERNPARCIFKRAYFRTRSLLRPLFIDGSVFGQRSTDRYQLSIIGTKLSAAIFEVNLPMF
jgi:hypothetical protein